MNLWLGVLVGLLVTQVSVFATTIYLHRGLAHKALTVHPGLAWACRAVVWITTGMRPREWAAVHRSHHANTDTAADPHSPIVHGFWRVQLGNVGLYRKAAGDKVTVKRYAKDLPPDRWDRILFDHSILGLGLGLVISILVLGLGTGLLAAGVHAVTYVMLSGAVNAVGHRVGDRPYANSATNGQLLALLTGGEGLHNNHHAAPTSATFALDTRAVDPGWWMIRALRRCHLVTVRHSDVKLKQAA